MKGSRQEEPSKVKELETKSESENDGVKCHACQSTLTPLCQPCSLCGLIFCQECSSTSTFAIVPPASHYTTTDIEHSNWICESCASVSQCQGNTLTRDEETPQSKKSMIYPAFVKDNNSSQSLKPPQSHMFKIPKHSQKSNITALGHGLGLARPMATHLAQIMTQAIITAQLSMSTWLPELVKVLTLANRIASHTCITSDSSMSLGKFVKIKKIPSGSPDQSCVIDGLVFRRSVSHKAMMRTIQSPKILLLSFAIEYQSNEHEFMSLEPLLQVEGPYLEKLVSQIVALKPDILWVEKSVSGLAIELFCKARIVVTQYVKPSVMKALAFATGAAIISSADMLDDSAISLGTCRAFEVQSFMTSDNRKLTYQYLHGCANVKAFGCTVIIHGGSREDLVKLKGILSTFTIYAHGLQLEQRFYLQVQDQIQWVDPYVSHSLKLLNASESSSSHSLPLWHQFLHVIQLKSPVTSSFLCEYESRHLQYYADDQDITLLAFFSLLTSAADICPSSKPPCPDPTALHVRSFVHHQSRITFTPLAFMKTALNQEPLQFGLKCSVCGAISPSASLVDPISLKMSLARYLEALVYHQWRLGTQLCAHTEANDPTLIQNVFYSANVPIVNVSIEHIALRKIIPPPRHLFVDLERQAKLRQSDYDDTKARISEFYDSIQARIRHFTFDIVPSSRLVASKTAMAELSNKCVQQKKTLLQRLHSSFVQSDKSDFLSLNVVFDPLKEEMKRWDQEFDLFMKRYLSGGVESGIRSISASHQFRRMFVESRVIQEGADHPSPKSIPYVAIDPDFIALGDSPILEGAELLPDSWEVDSSCKERLGGDSTTLDDGLFPELFPKIEFSGSSYSDYASPLIQPVPPAEMVWESLTSGIVSDVAVNPKPTASDTPVVRQSLIKTIANLWTGNIANFLPLSCPILGMEHVFMEGNLVIVREDEPSSIVAFTLNSYEYRSRFGLADESTNHGLAHPPSQALLNSECSQFNLPLDFEQEESTIQHDTEPTTSSAPPTDASPHFNYSFWSDVAKCSCKVYFAKEFHALRSQLGISEFIIQSLARSVLWDAMSGGKSGSTFFKSKDERLVCKQLSKPEIDSWSRFAPAYFEYVSGPVESLSVPPSMLAKIFGVFRTSYKNSVTGKTIKMDFMVMENIFYGRHVSHVFDLKGSLRNRYIPPTSGKPQQALLDENLIEYIQNNPLYASVSLEAGLKASIARDASFLAGMNVMDYSLLLGVDNHKQEIVIGIVDYIRTFTWDKKLESWVKDSFGGVKRGDQLTPTIISPRSYKSRFCDAIPRFFVWSPLPAETPVESENEEGTGVSQGAVMSGEDSHERVTNLTE